MPEYKGSDVTLYYESHGEGFPLLMIRGLGSNADHWYAQTPAFSKTYRVITFDNRGIARSACPAGSFSVRMMADDTLALMDHLGLEQAHLLGLSMGGMIAQELVLKQPNRVKGLILVCTHCGGENQLRPSADLETLFKEMVFVGSDEAKIAAAPTLFDTTTLSERPEVAQQYAQVSLKHPAGPEILIRQWEAVLGHDTYERLPEIKAPTLVLTGELDVLIPPENSEILARQIPNAALMKIPGGGHQILVEQPEACNRAIIEFLSRVDG